MRGEVTADEWTSNRSEPESRAENSLVTSACARRHNVSDDRLRRDHESAAAKSLNGAKDDQMTHRLAQTAERRTDQEDHDRNLKHAFAAVEIAEFAVDRRNDRLR